MPITVEHEDLKKYLPHRGINLLIDQLEMNDERTKGISHTRLSLDDDKGRQVFARKGADGKAYWYEPFLGELLALTGVPLKSEALAKEGKTSVFSMISRVHFDRLVPFDAEIRGETEIKRERGGFTTFACTAYADGEEFLKAEVLSGAASFDDITAVGTRAFSQEQSGEAIPRADWKGEAFNFADAVIESDEKSLRAFYEYPSDHVLVPGHFPNAALMMGVTQWAAFSDAAWELRRRLGLSEGITVSGNITREDGTDVVDIRDLQLTPTEDGSPLLANTKRIAFREPIRPGDGVFIQVERAG